MLANLVALLRWFDLMNPRLSWGHRQGTSKPGTLLRALVALALAFSALNVAAQSYSVLHVLTRDDGFGSAAPLLVTNGTVYGVGKARYASQHGSIFEVQTNGQGYAMLKRYSESDYGLGADPRGGLVIAGTNLYGTTFSTGISLGDGLVFTISTDGTFYSVLKTFQGADGSHPSATLTLSGDTLYGSTSEGGGLRDGTLFQIQTDGSGFQTLWHFDGTNGASPASALLLVGSQLFGTTLQGGISNCGTIFRITTNGSGFTVLKNFDGIEGGQPLGLTLVDTLLYGTTARGGKFSSDAPQGSGILFRLNLDGGQFSVLRQFTRAEGAPVGAPVFSAKTGLFYLTTMTGGLGRGSLFEVTPQGDGYFVLKAFWGNDGEYPEVGLTLSGDSLYGTTSGGNTNIYGNLFRLDPPLAPVPGAGPSNQVAAVGGPAVFQIEAGGTQPLAYQWLHHGTNPVNNASGSVLQLSNIQFADAGPYTVVISNAYGSVTSSSADLRVISPGVITNLSEPDLRAAVAIGGNHLFGTDGTIVLSAPITNLLDTGLDGLGHAVTLSGGDVTRLFRNTTNGILRLSNLTLTGGRATDPDGGAAVFNNGGAVFLTNVSLVQNYASNAVYYASNSVSGGALMNQAGQLIAANCFFFGNAAQNQNVSLAPDTNGLTAPALGGAICSLDGSVNLDHCAFVGNAVFAGPGAYIWHKYASVPGGWASGGAIFSSGLLTLRGCSFTGNSAQGGTGGPGDFAGFLSGGEGGPAQGGAVASVGTLIADACLFASNTATAGTGGDGGNATANCCIPGMGGGTGGTARGGAIFCIGDAHLINCTVATNLGFGGAGGQGGPGGAYFNMGTGRWIVQPGGYGGSGGNACGGIYASNATIQMTNCSVAFNAGFGGSQGLGGFGNPPGSPGLDGSALAAFCGTNALLANTLLATNSATNFSGLLVDLGHNLSSDASCRFTNQFSRALIDPRLAPLADNGGNTWTLALMNGSPAIDAGDIVSPPFDQRGRPRPVGPGPDIGAYEYGSPAILEPGPFSASGVTLTALGVPHDLFQLQASPDLVNWIPVRTNQFQPDGTFRFIDTPEAGTPRFYRLLLP